METKEKQRMFTEAFSNGIDHSVLFKELSKANRAYMLTDFGWVEIDWRYIENAVLNQFVYYLISDHEFIYVSKEKIKYDNKTL